MDKRIIALLLIVIVTTACVLLALFSIKKRVVINDIKRLSYSNSGGMDINSGSSYEIICNDKCIANIKLPYEIKKTNIEVDDKTMKEIIETLNNNDVSSWDGFDKDDKNVLDGSSFSFSVETKKGEKISAHGYMRYPKNYGLVTSKLHNIFMDLYRNNKDKTYLFDTESFEGFNIDGVTKVEVEKQTIGGKDRETITDKEQILKIYDEWKDVTIGERSTSSCDDNTIVYKFIMDDAREYKIEKECDSLIVDYNRYYFSKEKRNDSIIAKKIFERQTHQYFGREYNKQYFIDSDDDYRAFRDVYRTDLEIDDYDLSKYSVFIKTESEGSGSTRKVLNRVYVDNNKLLFDISTDRALIGTDDMVYWYFVAIIDKDQLINLDLSDWKRPSGE